MADTVTLSFRVSADKAERLDKLAKAMDRPRSWLLDQALGDYLGLQAWQIAHIEKGLAELDRGEGIADRDVDAWLRRARKSRKSDAAE